ncbi:Protein SOGA1, partial [Opisthocomus hoazin]
LRRSLLELEDQNKLLLNELTKYKSDHELDVTLSEDSCSVVSEPSQEELATAKVQISELSGKVKKLQYENRVLLSNLQRCDLASCQTTRPMLETDAEAGDSAQCIPTDGWRDGPPVVPGRANSESKRSRADPHPMGSAFGAAESSSGPAIPLLSGGASSCWGPGMSMVVGAMGTSPFLEHTRLFRVLFFCMCSLLFRRPIVLFSGFFFSSRSFGLFSLTCPRMQQPDFRDADPYHLPHAKDTDPAHPRMKELRLVLSEANESLRGLQEQLSQERQLRKDEVDNFSQKICQLKEDHQKALLRREFELQSLNLQRRLEQKFWSQEKNLLVQESQQFRQSFLLLFMKLKWFLKRWRQGKMVHSEGEDFLEVLSAVVPNTPVFPREDSRGAAVAAPQVQVPSWWPPPAAASLGSALPALQAVVSLSRSWVHQAGLQAEHSRAAPPWSHGSPTATHVSPQLERKAGKGITERALPDWKVALKREREEHQHLLAESYSAVMDLTKQLQISEKNWNQEKVELLARFKEEQQQAEQQAKDLQNKINQLQKGSNPWALKHSEMEKHSSNWKEALNEKITDKETISEAEAKGTNLKRTKSVSSMSEFESLLDCSPYLPG